MAEGARCSPPLRGGRPRCSATHGGTQLERTTPKVRLILFGVLDPGLRSRRPRVSESRCAAPLSGGRPPRRRRRAQQQESRARVGSVGRTPASPPQDVGRRRAAVHRTSGRPFPRLARMGRSSCGLGSGGHSAAELSPAPLQSRGRCTGLATCDALGAGGGCRCSSPGGPVLGAASAGLVPMSEGSRNVACPSRRSGSGASSPCPPCPSPQSGCPGDMPVAERSGRAVASTSVGS